MRTLLIILFPVILFSCSNERPYPWLAELDSKEGFEESGRNLMAVKMGLNLLEPSTKEETKVLIAVHGSNSRGYEWIYPLKTLDDDKTLTLFYRWDDGDCPNPSFLSLNNSIKKLIKENTKIEKVIIMGHSYGGLLVSMFAERWKLNVPAEIHSVAGALAGLPRLNLKCNYEKPNFISNNVEFFEWRTQKALDNAYKDLETDPQTIDLEGSKVRRLPELYRGKRLGHNWSISWVADEIKP